MLRNCCTRRFDWLYLRTSDMIEFPRGIRVMEGILVLVLGALLKMDLSPLMSPAFLMRYDIFSSGRIVQTCESALLVLRAHLDWLHGMRQKRFLQSA